MEKTIKKNIKKIKKDIKKILLYIIIPLLVISIFINLSLLLKPEKKAYKIDQNIVFFGDSITNKYNIEEFYPNSFVVNSGISGDTTLDLLDRIENDVYKYNPSKVILLIGINDMNHDISNEDIIKNMQKIVNGIKMNRPNSKIYIESVYPINRESLKSNNYNLNEKINNTEIIKLNEEIKYLCKENNLTYINIYDYLLDDNGNLKNNYTIEGLHLNDLGYFKVTTELQKYVYK